VIVCQIGVAIASSAPQECAALRHRWLTIAIALAAACAFAIAVQGGRWWSVGDVEIGPFGSRSCVTGECRPTNLGWVGGSERWIRTGMGTWAAGLIAMLLLLMIAGALAAKRVPRLVARTALVAIATGALTGALFVVQYPGVTGASVDRGLWLFGGAIVLGTFAAVRVLRVKPSAA
jgi:hypothetical protein